MGSYKKLRPLSVVVWIELNEEQVADLYVALKKAGEVVQQATYDGHFMHAGMLLNTAELVYKNHRISKRQLAFLQRMYHWQLKDTLYIQGLEYWLLDNEERLARWLKNKETKRLKAEAKKNGTENQSGL